jgi:predicted Zn-dependent protease
MIRRWPLLIALPLALAACGSAGEGPAVSEADRESGAELHPQLLAEFGGEYRGDEADYVKRLGGQLARAANLDGQCTFTLVNSDVVNAFAVPGCYIYVTRGLLAIVNSEAELGAVLGHELGHIVGRHSARQQKRSLWQTLGVVAVAVLTGSEQLTQIAGAAAGLFGLRYSRAQEYEADDLGIRYLRAAGLDPYESADMLDALGRHEAHLTRTRGRDEARSIPEWARTHPLSGNRAGRALAAAEGMGLADDQLPERRAAYLATIDGMLFGDDPEQGFVLGRRFAHPVMRIAFEAPPGFTLTNSPQAILIEGPGGLRGQFAAMRGSGSLARDTERLLTQLFEGASVAVTGTQAARINGLDALISEARASANGQEVGVTVAAYAAGRATYYFVIIGDSAASAGPLFASFRRLSPAEAAALGSRRIAVVRAGPGDSAEGLARLMAAEDPLATFRLINALDPGAPLRPGEAVKLVVPGGR